MKNDPHAQDLSYAQIMNLKNEAREQQVSAIYAADEHALESAAQAIKEVLRGAGNIARPRRFMAASS